MLTRFAIPALLFALAAAVGAGEGARLPLEDARPVADQTLGLEKAVEIGLPPLPARAGMAIILRFRMVSYTDREAGCNYSGAVELNGVPVWSWCQAPSMP